jgi:predicted ribosomally synthesized peptide with SipW-like signal peptide
MEAISSVQTDPIRRSRHRRALLALLVVSSLAAVGAGAASLAYFTDTTQASSGSWTTGTIKLGVTPATAWTATGVMPGDTGSQTIKVDNTGTGQLRYAVSTVISGETKGLASQLQMTINAGSCAAPGASIYTGTVVGAKIGNPAQGNQTDDRVLDAGTTENLCFAWSFPFGSDNTFQGATATATFSFAAEQTAHN